MPHTEPTPETATKTHTYYTNPVYKSYFAAPFVWEHQGVYYPIGTGAKEAEGQVEEIADAVRADRSTDELRIFPLLRSDDFLTWHFAGNALLRPDPALGDNFWAPEVAYCDGKFYLYYSVGHEDKNHQLRVATSDRPLGPYQDVGSLLDPSDCPFAIAPHPFCDDDGQWYLFYARDFLDSEGGVRAGTALMVDRLQGMTKLAGEGKVVLRARSNWQRFQANRSMYGGIYNWQSIPKARVSMKHTRQGCLLPLVSPA